MSATPARPRSRPVLSAGSPFRRCPRTTSRCSRSRSTSRRRTSPRTRRSSYDYDIVYVRAPRKGDKVRKRYWTEISQPGHHGRRRRPDAAAPRRQRRRCSSPAATGSVTDPFVSFDGEWVYYVALPQPDRSASQWTPPREGADIYKIHVKTRQDRPADAPGVHAQHRRRRLVEATSARPSRARRTSPTASSTWAPARCPAAGSSSPATATPSCRRKATRASRLQLFVMDDDGSNVEQIGHLNIGLRPAPGRPQGRPHHVQLARIAGPAQRASCGASGPSTPTAPTGARSSAPSARRGAPNALPLPDAALRRHASSSRSTTTRTTAASARYVKLPPTPPDGYAGVRPGVHATTRATRRCGIGRHRQRQGAVLPHAVQPVRHRVADAVRARTATARPIRPILGDKNSPRGRQVHASRPARRTTTC